LDALALLAAQDADSHELLEAFAAIPPPVSVPSARMAAAIARELAVLPESLQGRRDRARAVVARARLWRIATRSGLS
jgi:hypothetical protein